MQNRTSPLKSKKNTQVKNKQKTKNENVKKLSDLLSVSWSFPSKTTPPINEQWSVRSAVMQLNVQPITATLASSPNNVKKKSLQIKKEHIRKRGMACCVRDA